MKIILRAEFWVQWRKKFVVNAISIVKQFADWFHSVIFVESYSL